MDLVDFFYLFLDVLLWEEKKKKKCANRFIFIYLKKFICQRGAFFTVRFKHSPVSSLLAYISVAQDGQAEIQAMKYESQSTELIVMSL